MNKEIIFQYLDHAPDEVFELVWTWMTANRREVEDATDYRWCDRCEDFKEVRYHVTKRAGMDGPEEGVDCCAGCGRADYDS